MRRFYKFKTKVLFVLANKPVERGREGCEAASIACFVEFVSQFRDQLRDYNVGPPKLSIKVPKDMASSEVM